MEKEKDGSRHGWTVSWDTRKISKRTGEPIIHNYTNEDINAVIRKEVEMRKKGYRVSQTVQCIF